MLLSNPENGSRRSPPPLHGLIAVSLSDSTIAEGRRRGAAVAGRVAPSPPPPSSSSPVRPPPPPTATR